MVKRKLCTKKGCDNLARFHERRRDGSILYGKLCDTHHRKMYGMVRNTNDWFVRKMPAKKCEICGWVGPCDRHRIVYGKKGGLYTKSNIKVVCPNCHRLIHRKLLTFK